MATGGRAVAAGGRLSGEWSASAARGVCHPVDACPLRFPSPVVFRRVYSRRSRAWSARMAARASSGGTGRENM